jgi:tetratricopeptide (TPR) repeat protein
MNLTRICRIAWLAALCGSIQFASADVYPIILHGKVIMDDGSVPPVTFSLERICSDVNGSMPGVLTDKKGEYIWRMNIDPLESRDCHIRAHHDGYISTSVEVSGVDTIHTTLDLPPIKVHAAAADPYTLHFSDNNITGKAKADWQAAIKALDAQNISEVASHLDAVVVAAPKATQAWHSLGVVDERLGKLAEARAAYEHAISLEPKLLPSYVTLTRLCIKTQDWSCVAKTSEALIKQDPKHLYSEVYLHQAVALYELKDLAAAQASVEEEIRLDPQNQHPRAQYVLGRILEAKGDLAGAKEHMAAYLKLEPAPADIDQVRPHVENLGKPGAPATADPELEVF